MQALCFSSVETTEDIFEIKDNVIYFTPQTVIFEILDETNKDKIIINDFLSIS